MKQFLKRLMLGVVTLAMFCCVTPAAFAAGPNYYTINLERQGGIGTPEYVFVYRNRVDGADVYKSSSLPKPTMEGYTFDGWYTDIEGGTKVDGDYNFLSDGQTVYAHWSVAPSKTTDTTTTKPESTFKLEDHLGTIVVVGTTVLVVTLVAMHG